MKLCCGRSTVIFSNGDDVDEDNKGANKEETGRNIFV